MEKPLKIIFFGREFFGSRGLENIINNPRLNKNIKVVGVVTSLNNHNTQIVKNMADHFKIPIFCGDLYTEEAYEWINDLSPNYGVVMQFDKIPKRIIDSFTHYIINAHPTHLPKYRGGSPWESLIVNNEKLVITVHKITTNLDDGPWIIKTNPEDIEDIDRETLYKLSALRGVKAVEDALVKILTGKVILHEQYGEVSYCWRYDLEKLLRIDWKNDRVEKILRKVRAGYKNTGAICFINERNYLLECRIFNAFHRVCEHSFNFGQVLNSKNNIYKVACKNGFLFITEIRQANNPADPDQIMCILDKYSQSKIILQ